MLIFIMVCVVALTVRLPHGMVIVDVHLGVEPFLDLMPVPTSKLVYHPDGPGSTWPVCKVKEVLKHSHCKWMLRINVGNETTVSTVIITALNCLHLCISPEDLLNCVVNGQCIGPGQISLDDDRSRQWITIHSSSLNPWIGSPICPIQIPTENIKFK